MFADAQRQSVSWKSQMRKLEVKLSGGLGNQIFQYYAGLVISQLHEREVVLDLTDVARSHSEQTIQSFQIQAIFKTHRIKRYLRNHIKTLSRLEGWCRSRADNHMVDVTYEVNIEKAKEYKIDSISGYFQDFRYLDNYRANPLKLRNPSTMFLRLEESVRNQIYLAVHIRRGDFIGQSSSHGCISANWYVREIGTLINDHSDIQQIVFFSDDMEWVEQNIIGKIKPGKIEVVLSASELVDPAESWTLISHANFIVCANSTFSLTASYFSKAKVIIPWPLTRNENFQHISKTSPEQWILAPTIWESESLSK